MTGPALKRGEKSLEINGGNVVYEILGKEGDFIAMTPGGRFSKDIEGLRPLAQALVKGGYRVLLWDRPNCGKSDVQFYGQSESHMRAETLHKLITGLGIGRCIIAGGSGGARDSMLTTMLYPEIVHKLVVWNIVGGVYGSFVLGSYYIVPSILAVRGTGMQGVAHVGEWKERIAENSANRDRLLSTGPRRVSQADAALAERVRAEARPDHPWCPRRDVRQHHGAYTDHPRWRERLDHPERTSLEVSCLIKGSELIDPPWPEDAWERASEARASGQGQAVQHVRHLGTGRARDPEVSG